LKRKIKQDKLSLKTKLLREIFNYAPERFREEDLNKHPLAKRFQLSEKKLKNNLDFLV